ncbi:hypothetical protein [Streptomyces sp. NPDC051219]|uniref:hypothetical protein n=1 Tax=Streptomyces sp. NPDC051219 TaxID=3155283 RepID=UPI003444A98E
MQQVENSLLEMAVDLELIDVTQRLQLERLKDDRNAVAEHETHVSPRRHREGRTSPLVSHRLGAVREADAIVVLDEGKVVEQGDHATLMAADGVYARLFTLQACGYRTDGEQDPVLAGGG